MPAPAPGAIRASKNHQTTKQHHRYLDQYYTKREKLPSIPDTGMMVFRDTMFPMVKNDLTTAIIDMVTLEREGSAIDRGLLKSVVTLFVEMGLGSMDTYRNGFEAGFLATTLVRQPRWHFFEQLVQQGGILLGGLSEGQAGAEYAYEVTLARHHDLLLVDLEHLLLELGHQLRLRLGMQVVGHARFLARQHGVTELEVLRQRVIHVGFREARVIGGGRRQETGLEAADRRTGRA